MIAEISNECSRQCGIDLGNYLTGVVEGRIRERVSHLRLGTQRAYLEHLRHDPLECPRLVDSLIVKVSSFFRDPLVFEWIAQRLIPDIFDRNHSLGRGDIRFWCAGCAAGEEAYSLAILIQETDSHSAPELKSYIFGTDISCTALEATRSGIYPKSSLANVKFAQLEKYFHARDKRREHYEIDPAIRNMVQFAYDDLTTRHRIAPAASVFGTFDLILNRNVAIYLTTEVQNWISTKLYRALNRGGYLILGEAENLNPEVASRMIVVDPSLRIFQKPL